MNQIQSHLRNLARVGLIVLSVTISSHPSNSPAQGALTPPGAPAPMMKTLAQVEPRTPISTLPYTITQSGSYYLTTNLISNSGGITITTNGVTLDLMGFELAGSPGNGANGILVSGTRTNIVVRNGTIRGWTFEPVTGQFTTQTVFENLQLVASINGNGLDVGPFSRVANCTVFGSSTAIRVGENSVVSACTVVSNSQTGISVAKSSIVRDCVARFSARDFGWGIDAGDGCTITSCSVFNCSETVLNTLDPGGIRAGNYCVIKDCAVSANSGAGIRAGSGNTIISCTSGNNTWEGIRVVDGNTIQNCTARGNGRSGIFVRNSNYVKENVCDANPVDRSAYAGITAGANSGDVWNRIEGNSCTFNFIGIRVNGTGHLITRNWAAGNVTAYSFDAGNVWAAPTVTISNISANTSPHANYAY